MAMEATEGIRAVVQTAEGVVLQWRNVSYSVTKKGKPTEPDVKVILANLSGDTEGGRLLCLMGPSGSGKTSLLNALAFRVPKGPGAEISGCIYADGVLVDTPAQVRSQQQNKRAHHHTHTQVD
jgi:ABC-type multidrug transport system ATPase subunit